MTGIGSTGSVREKARATYSDGTVYTGDFMNGKRHGKGEIVTPAGFQV